MSYTPTNWQTGDTVTAEKLNNMESGIEAAKSSFIIQLTPTAQDFSGVMDKTGDEIYAAYQAGRIIEGHIGALGTHFVFTAFSETNDGQSVDGVYASAFVLYSEETDMLIQVITGARSDTNYYTKIFPLTPMS